MEKKIWDDILFYIHADFDEDEGNLFKTQLSAAQ